LDSTPASHGSRTWSVGLALVVVAVGAALILGLTFPLTAAVAEHWTPSAPWGHLLGASTWGRLLGGVYALHTLAYAAGLAIAPAVAGLIAGQAGLPTAGTLAAMAIGDYSASGLSISLPLPHTATHPRKPTVLVRDLSTREVAVKWIAHFRYSAIPQLFERAGRDQRCKSQATLGVRPSQPTSPAVEEQVYGLVRQNEPPVARSDAQVALPAPPGG